MSQEPRPDPVQGQLGFRPLAPGAQTDPLREQECSPVPGLIRRYENRVLLLATDRCFVQCAFCTRQGFVRTDGDSNLTVDFPAALRHIRHHPEIREVLVSGGDPLTLTDEVLDDLLSSLRAIPHVSLIRVATRAPMGRPSRVTPRLVDMLRRHSPVMVCVHFNHPAELTDEARLACASLSDAGLVLMNQTVLLAGINDDAETLIRLCMDLASMRVRPYYLLSCDRVEGTEEFWVDLGRAMSIVDELQRRLPGHAIPAFVVDLPGWAGKARISPATGLQRVEGGWLVTGPTGEQHLLSK